MAALPWITYLQRMVGRGHPTLADTLNTPLRNLLTQSGYDPDATNVMLSSFSKTVNAGSNAFTGTAEVRLTAAIALAATLGWTAVYVPNKAWDGIALLPYNASLVTFNTAVRMVREGSDPGEFDVEAYGAAPNFAQSDATCAAGIQAAVDAQNAAGRGVIRLPSATYNITTIKFYSGTILRGMGIRGTLNVNGTQLFQGSFAGPILQPNSPGSTSSAFHFEDFALSAFGNVNNTGGLDLTNCFGFTVSDVTVTGAAVYGIRIVGGPVAGNAGFGHFTRVQLLNMQTGGYCWVIASSATDQPDGCTFTDCYSTTATGTWIRYQAATRASAGSCSWLGCSFECVGGSATVDVTYDALGAGTNTFTACRFENTGTGGIQVTLNGLNISPAAVFDSCTFAPGAGGLTWVDNGPVRSPRMNCTSGGAPYYFNQWTMGVEDRAVAMISGVAPALDASLGNIFTLTILTNIAVVVAVPTNQPQAGFSKDIVVVIRNGSGGALSTAPTFNTGANGFKFSAVTNPANSTQVVYRFRWDPVQSFWYEVGTHLAAGL